MKTLKFVIALLMVLGLAVPCFAAATSGAIAVSATVPTLSQSLIVKIFPVTPGTPDVWDTTPVLTMEGFGGLTMDTKNNIWKAGKYYAMEVSVLDNSGTEWNIAVAKSSVKLATASDNLDYNINVHFRKCVKSGDLTVESDINGVGPKVSFANSAVAAGLITKTKLSGGWLRIYYGIGTGDTKDAADVDPIALDKKAGTYAGSVTLTLAP